MIVSELIYVALVPLSVAAAAALVVRRLRIQPPVAWAAGVGLGYVAGHVALASRSGVARALRSLVAPRHDSVNERIRPSERCVHRDPICLSE